MKGYPICVIGADVLPSDKDCAIWINSEGSLSDDAKQFGPSLRAPPFFPSWRSIVSVLGIFSSSKANTRKPTEESSLKTLTPDMEMNGGNEYLMQSLNAVSVTKKPPINSGPIMEEEANKEGVNEACKICRSPTDLGNINHAIKSMSEDTQVTEFKLKANEPHVPPTSTTRDPNNQNTQSHENKANPHDTPNLYQDPTSNTHPQTAT